MPGPPFHTSQHGLKLSFEPLRGGSLKAAFAPGVRECCGPALRHRDPRGDCDMMGSGKHQVSGAESVQLGASPCPYTCLSTGPEKVSSSGAPGRRLSAFLVWLQFQQNKSTSWRARAKLTLSHFRKDWKSSSSRGRLPHTQGSMSSSAEGA